MRIKIDRDLPYAAQCAGCYGTNVSEIAPTPIHDLEIGSVIRTGVYFRMRLCAGCMTDLADDLVEAVVRLKLGEEVEVDS